MKRILEMDDSFLIFMISMMLVIGGRIFILFLNTDEMREVKQFEQVSVLQELVMDVEFEEVKMNDGSTNLVEPWIQELFKDNNNIHGLEDKLIIKGNQSFTYLLPKSSLIYGWR